MPAPKGFRPPAAGKGRAKGVPNKTPAALREVVALFVQNNAEGAQALYDRVAKTNPARALELLARFAEFVLPRQKEVMGTAASIQINVGSGLITSPADAAAAYAAVCRDPSLDLTGLTFAAPGPSTAAARPADDSTDERSRRDRITGSKDL